MAGLKQLAREIVTRRHRCTHVTSIVHVFRVPSSSDGGIGGYAVVDRVDASERIDIYFQVGQSGVRARLERRRVTSGGRVKYVYGSKDGVGIDSGATTTSVSGEVTTGGVFVTLNGRSAMERRVV